MARSVMNGSVSGSSGEKINMRLAKIKDSYMFNPASSGYHVYAVYTDKGSGKLRAIETTHLYTKDEKRFRQLKRSDPMGLIKCKFSAYETPSGVYKRYFDKSYDGLDLDSKQFVYLKNDYVSEKQALFILDNLTGRVSSKK